MANDQPTIPKKNKLGRRGSVVTGEPAHYEPDNVTTGETAATRPTLAAVPPSVEQPVATTAPATAPEQTKPAPKRETPPAPAATTPERPRARRRKKRDPGKKLEDWDLVSFNSNITHTLKRHIDIYAATCGLEKQDVLEAAMIEFLGARGISVEPYLDSPYVPPPAAGK